MATCRSFSPKPSGTSPTPSRHGDVAATVLSFKPQDSQGYGRIVLDTDGSLLRIVEQKDCTPEEAAIGECNAGCYAFDGAQLKAHIGEVGCDNAQHEYYLPDMLGILREAGERVASYCCEDYRDGLGVNSRSQLAELTAVARDRINERLMAEGVTFIDPAQAWIGPGRDRRSRHGHLAADAPHRHLRRGRGLRARPEYAPHERARGRSLLRGRDGRHRRGVGERHHVPVPAPTCAPARMSSTARTLARMSRSRNRPSARARRCPTSRISATLPWVQA